MASGRPPMSPVVLRRAGPGDLDAILELNGAGNGEHIRTEMDVAFRCHGMEPADYAVAVADGRVVATVGLLATRLQVGSVTLPLGQPEYVTTDPEYQGRGLAGRLLAMVHEWSEARCDLVQMIAGVAYFYRQYGYSYGLRRPLTYAVPPERELSLPAGWEVRSAQSGDVGRIQELQAAAAARVVVALPFADDLWPTFLELPAAPLLVGVYHGRVEAVARLRVKAGFPVQVQALAASPSCAVAGTQAILAGARARHLGATLIVTDREGSATQAVIGPAYPTGGHSWLYLRVPSLPPLLSALVPVLNERLAHSAWSAESAVLNISLYRSSVRLVIEHGRVVEVASAAGVHQPDDDGGVGIAPDLVPMLLFGPDGVLALADHPDVYLGRFRPLMAALFPPLTLDVLVW
jgi:GNAT superfamily N-acetyltransferase